MVGGSGWRSRIVGEGEVAPGELAAHPGNWRRHPAHQRAALSGVLGEVGWVQRVIVNRTTGRIVDGHARVALAVERAEATVPVVYVDLSEAEEALVLASFDPIGALAGANVGALEALLREVSTGDEALRAVLSDVAVASGMYPYTPPHAVGDPAADPSRALWPRLNTQVSPETLLRWAAAMASLGGDGDAKVGALLGLAGH